MMTRLHLVATLASTSLLPYCSEVTLLFVIISIAIIVPDTSNREVQERGIQVRLQIFFGYYIIFY
jgi:hypothetical protein